MWRYVEENLLKCNNLLIPQIQTKEKKTINEIKRFRQTDTIVGQTDKILELGSESRLGASICHGKDTFLAPNDKPA